MSVNGWDVGGKSSLTHEATDTVISNELNGDTSGLSILKSAFGDRKESLVHTVPLNSNEAQVEAESVLKMTARRFVVAHGVAPPGGTIDRWLSSCRGPGRARRQSLRRVVPNCRPRGRVL